MVAVAQQQTEQESAGCGACTLLFYHFVIILLSFCYHFRSITKWLEMKLLLVFVIILLSFCYHSRGITKWLEMKLLLVLNSFI